jgi:Protein of unknown function (DUF2985)
MAVDEENPSRGNRPASDEPAAVSYIGEDVQRSCEGPGWDWLIDFTQGMLAPPIGIVWFVIMVFVGAAFFFLLIGVVPLSPQSEKEKWLNISIQALNVVFTYAAIANFPFRCRKLIRLYRVYDTVEITYEGLPSTEILDYVAWIDRRNIWVILILNCVFQFINQLFRIKYHTFELSNNGIAVLWVNLFFVGSFACAMWAPAYQWRAEQRVRREGRAPPGEELDPLQKFAGKEDYTIGDLWNAVKDLLSESPEGSNPREGEMPEVELDEIPEVELDGMARVELGGMAEVELDEMAAVRKGEEVSILEDEEVIILDEKVSGEGAL